MADLMTLIDEHRNAEREYGRNPRNSAALFTATKTYNQIEEVVAGLEGRSAFETAKRQVDAKPVAYITKTALENWLNGVDPETHVFLRKSSPFRVPLYASPVTADSQTLLAELLSRIDFDGMDPNSFTISELRRAI